MYFLQRGNSAIISVGILLPFFCHPTCITIKRIDLQNEANDRVDSVFSVKMLTEKVLLLRFAMNAS